MLEVEDQLLCPTLQDQAGGAYDNLKKQFWMLSAKTETSNVESQAKKNAKYASDDYARHD